MPRFPYNPEKAKALLAEAGWRPNAEGILEKDGKPFDFTILTNQGNDIRVRTGEIIQRRLQEVGIVVKLRTVEWAAFIKEFINKGRFEAVLLGWTTGQDPDLYDIWHSSKTKQGELNFIHYNNPEVDRLLMEGRHTFDREKRQSLLPPPGDHRPGPALHLSVRAGCPPGHFQALPGHKAGPGRYRLQLSQVVRAQRGAKIHHIALLGTVELRGSYFPLFTLKAPPHPPSEHPPGLLQ